MTKRQILAREYVVEIIMEKRNCKANYRVFPASISVQFKLKYSNKYINIYKVCSAADNVFPPGVIEREKN